MRLSCPNCDAQYEVPDEVIPKAGRDVQCSNCSNTWFFRPVDPSELESAEATEEATAAPAPEAEPAPEPQQPPQSEPEEVPAPTQRKKMDPAVEQVLREEAELEARARAAARETIETQPELGLDGGDLRDEAARRAEEARARMARMRGSASQQPAEANTGSARQAAGAVAAATAAEGTRRGLLPDVEEINSTLRADEDRDSAENAAGAHSELPEQRRGSFTRGFAFMVLLAAAAFAVYLFAPQLSDAVPGLAGPLESYTSAVENGRAWLDSTVLSLLGALDGLSSEGAAASTNE